MKYSKMSLFLGAASLLFLINTADAGSKPSGSRSASPSVINAKYAGKSWKWDSKGGVYFGTNGKSEAIYRSAVGLGTWTVSGSGTLCNNATWYWEENGTKKKKREKSCWKHVVAKDGKLWTREGKKNNWYELRFNKISGGNRYKSKVRRLKKKLGL